MNNEHWCALKNRLWNNIIMRFTIIYIRIYVRWCWWPVRWYGWVMCSVIGCCGWSFRCNSTVRISAYKKWDCSHTRHKLFGFGITTVQWLYWILLLLTQLTHGSIERHLFTCHGWLQVAVDWVLFDAVDVCLLHLLLPIMHLITIITLVEIKFNWCCIVHVPQRRQLPLYRGECLVWMS